LELSVGIKTQTTEPCYQETCVGKAGLHRFVTEHIACPHADTGVLVKIMKGAGYKEGTKEMARDSFNFWVWPTFPN
jgi:hypothetical protein